MNKIFALILVISLSLTCLSCGKKQQTDSSGQNVNQSEIEKIKSLISLKKNEKVVLDSPKKFIELWILFNLEQKAWLAEFSAHTNTDTNDTSDQRATQILAEKRAAFYKSYGVTEAEFTDYSVNHMREINTFLDKNPEYKDAYEKSMD